jgi:ATP-dependent Clp protease ATP-binding subunit ClpB
MTSNIGSTIIQAAFENVTEKNVDDVTETAKIEVMALLRQTIRPEFLNRVDEIIMFKPLMKKEIMGIVKIQLENLKKLVGNSGIQLNFSDYLLEFLSEQGFDPQFGARPLKRLIQKEIVNTLSKRILAGDIDKSRPVLVDVFDNTVVFRNEENGQLSSKSKGKKTIP